MRHHRFVSRLLNRPQLITPAAGAAVAAVLMPGVRMDGWDGSPASDARDPREYDVVGRTAVVPIVGELVHRGGGMDALSGVTSYAALQDMLGDALADDSVTGIVLDVDSPGGEAGGNLDFAEWLAAQRGGKPIVACINSQACSGAYSITSAADQVVIGADALAGSIGVVTYHVDLSRMMANEGVIVTYVYAGDRKIDANPAQPLSPEAQAAIQGAVDTIYARFCSVVAANRGISVQAVRDTQAAIYVGQDAVAAGLADKVATLEDAMLAVSTRSAPPGARLTVNRTGAFSMSDNSNPTPAAPAAPPPSPAPSPAPAPAPEPASPGGEPGAAPADAPGERTPTPPASPGYGPADPVAVAEACAQAGHPELTAGLLRAKASMGDVKVDIARAQEITKVAGSLSVPKMAAPAIAGGVSVETFRAMAFEAKSGGETKIDTTVPSPAAAAAGSGQLDVRGIYRNLAEQRRAQASGRRH